MSKILSCRDLVTGCTAVFRGVTEEDVIKQEIEHSRSAHHLGEVPKSLERKMHRLVQDDRKG